MSAISSNAGAVRRQSSGIANALHLWLAKAEQRRRIRREMKELSQLSDHLLRDMGLEQFAEPRDPAIPHHWR